MSVPSDGYFESYNEKVAEGLARAHEKGGGLPGFLGIRIVEWWPGGLRGDTVGLRLGVFGIELQQPG